MSGLFFRLKSAMLFAAIACAFTGCGGQDTCNGSERPIFALQQNLGARNSFSQDANSGHLAPNWC